MREPSRLLALAAIAPFLLAFAPPEEPGTTVSVTAGTGRFISSTGCARPRMVEYAHQEAGVHHQWAHRGDRSKRYGLGLEGAMAQSREKECAEEDCRNPGWGELPPAYALSPYGTLDWKWLGLKAGARLQLHRDSIDGSGGKHPPGGMLGFPVRGALRLGYPDRLYVSCEILEGGPMTTALRFPIGIGGRIRGTDLWAAPVPDFTDYGISARIARQVGPVRLRLSGRWHRDPVTHTESGGGEGGGAGETFRVSVPEFSAAAGLDYHLPW